MYLNILKKDLRHKKTMNIILLLFAILASMFVSAGLANVVTVMNGTDYFLDLAGVEDYVIITQNGGENVEEILKSSPNVTSYKKENCFWGSKDDLSVEGKKIELKNNTLLIQHLEETGIKFFKMDNSQLAHINKGDIYVTSGFLSSNNLKVGDILKVEFGDTNKSYRIAGEMKDAFLGSDMMGNTRLLISNEDYRDYTKSQSLLPYLGSLYYVASDNVKALGEEISPAENVLFSDSREIVKLCYVMEMIIAMIVLVLSVCLIIVSFVLLKFVISFSISKEFREIGVMKAIGIRNFKIRSLYITKYLAMAIIGGIAGFVLGIPFGNFLTGAVSKKMILGNNYGIAVNVCGSILVIVIMSIFTYLCTGKIKKASPVNAIRSGQTGERYGKKSIYSIKKSHLGNAFYMALNDVLSAPKRFVTIIISFFLCSILVFGIVEVTDTMKSDRLITAFTKKSDMYINDAKILKMEFLSSDGDAYLDETSKKIEEDLKSLDMPARVSADVLYRYPLTFDGNTSSFVFQQNTKAKASEYEYSKGSAPQKRNEIAITPIVSDKLGAYIGDRVTIDFGTEKLDCIITAIFQSMDQLGSVIRLHEDAPTSLANASALMSFQVDFNDKPSAKEIAKRIDIVKDFYDIDDVFDAAMYSDDCMHVSKTMEKVSKLLLLITCIVVVLVTILMERSFIQEEVHEIALLKAIGFKNSFIIKWQSIRFMIVTVTSLLLAIILTYPITKLWCDPIWKMMGAYHVSYYFNPLSLLVVYPGIILLLNLVAVLLTAMHTNKITSKDIMNIE
ncbi:putative ABC transport system permease protein [Acetitomaculum ruminis DSM 5522]|uniref:Putative ABC transport system permease protein n=1 Tax=Acetitomaculum ruminis DSM 5522 TaxID=1120918 RepID=A0A1I0Y3V3_9FIRM|nr:ABC transporter permease [Acetitomaculum ruminis]SFB07577.1 putative ABC transport system permease protein [Acetitomaculum ruminis DSM 5522]